MFDFNEYQQKHPFNENYGFRCLPNLVCVDGFRISVQASYTHYCSPRESFVPFYGAVECGFPSEMVPELMPYAEDPDTPLDTVYGWVPVRIVNDLINSHGGLKNGL